MKNSLKCIAQIVLYMVLYNVIYFIFFFLYAIIAALIATFPLLGFFSGLSYAGCGAIIIIGAIGICNLIGLIYIKLFKEGIFRFAAIAIIIISVVEGFVIIFDAFRINGLSWDAVDISAYPVILFIGTTIIMLGFIRDAEIGMNDFISPKKYQALSKIFLPSATENYYHPPVQAQQQVQDYRPPVQVQQRVPEIIDQAVVINSGGVPALDDLTVLNQKYAESFRNYRHPYTGKPIMSAQDYLDALDSQTTKRNIVSDHILSMAELDNMFAQKFSKVKDPIKGTPILSANDFIVAFNNQEALKKN